MPSLAEVQAEFARALCDAGPGTRGSVPRSILHADDSNSRFDVYRNNRMTSLIDALESTFPATCRLVGDEYFRAVAREYVGRHPPRSPVLLCYGQLFGEFLENFPSASGVPYLGDVARLEWARVNAHHAADAEPVGIDALADVPESQLDRVTMTLHPSLGVVRSCWPIVSLWSACLEPDSQHPVDMAVSETAVVVRPASTVGVYLLPPGGDTLLADLGRGSTLASAAQHATDLAIGFDLARQLGLMFHIGSVTSVRPSAGNHDH